MRRLVNELHDLQVKIPALHQSYEKWKIDSRKEYEDKRERYDRALSKVIHLDAEWPDTERELRMGLYCSRCEKSKSEIERASGISFEKHLDNVKGTRISAPASLIKKKYDEYLAKRTKGTQEAIRLGQELDQFENNANRNMQEMEAKLSAAQEQLANNQHDGRVLGDTMNKTYTILMYVKKTWENKCLKKIPARKPPPLHNPFKVLYDQLTGKKPPEFELLIEEE